MNVDLIIVTPDHQTRRVALTGEALTLGRAHSNDLSYPEDASLSRQHCRFQSDEQGWWAEDLGSKNGTMINETRITSRHLLRPGDRITAGHLTITLVDTDAEVDSNAVVFVRGSGQEISPDATVMTSLEGVLSSGDITSPLTRMVSQQRRRGESFNTPEVQALIRAGRLLADRMPLEDLFPLILDHSIDAVGAERGVLMTLESDRLLTRAVHGEGFRISTTVRDRVLKEKTSLLVRDLQRDEAFKQQVSIFEQRIHTMMAVPLQTEDRVIGLIYVDSRSFVREFTPDDLNLLTVLANVAAIRIEHQRLAEIEDQDRRRTADLHKAAVIQRRFLPSEAPRIKGLDAAGHNAPCQTVGGDYYDFISYPDGRLAVVLADVAGKGMEAALLMSNLQAAVQILAEFAPDLSSVMSRLDRSVTVNCPSNRFITMFFAVFDPANGKVDYCNAGHNPPVLVRASGDVETLKAEGTVLGILPQLGYETKSSAFEPGDLFAVYSDGVTEAEGPNNEEFGEQKLAALLKTHRSQPAEKIIESVNETLDEWTNSAPAADDITLVVVRRTDEPPGPNAD
jgi:serine phosphatase RsbU (regulator of sigma subunit)/pSer/pThr/pTyr-binding forkhead associated (FHA) protein